MTLESTHGPPPGYLSWREGEIDVVALEPLARGVREALEEGSLYEYAAHHPDAVPLAGRGIAYAVPLPGGLADGVVRRSRHGGLLAPVTGERFVGDTRAPIELENALRLTRLGVPTPEVLAYATYPAGPMLRRADVVTRLVPGSRDLAERLSDDGGVEDATALMRAVALLIARMAGACARHPDLNLKNVLITEDDDGHFDAMLLDVDRVWFDREGASRATAANLRRFARSARKWRRLRGLPVEEAHLLALETEVAALAGAPGATPS
ncbi:MAG TPA: lipopolysaccharide kinase InaA family protein [Gemmatimonadaceae bacterium]|nr:lipopolysaccharide kinase InaA family protein [Gemmatimonadaceae bacterium]